MKKISRTFGGKEYSDYLFETLFKRHLKERLKEDYAREYADGEFDRIWVEIESMERAVVTHPANDDPDCDIDEIETLRIYKNYFDENGEYDFDFDFDKICYDTIGLLYTY